MPSKSYQLLMRLGPTPGKLFSLNQPEITIGRDVGNAIVINDPEVSRTHTRFSFQGNGYLVEDLNSTNGTYVNGQRLMGPHLLRAGELILLGESIGLVYEVLEFDQDVTLAPAPVGQAQPQAASPFATPPAQQAGMPESKEIPATAVPSSLPTSAMDDFVYPQAETQRNWRPWLFAGIGCSVVLLCGFVGMLLVVDTLNLWCDPPFRQVISLFGFVCP